MTAPRSPPLLPLPSPLLTTTNEPAWRACQHGGWHGGWRCVRGVWAESFGEILLVFATALILFTWALRPRRSCAQEALPTVRERLLLRPEGAEKAHSKEKGQVTKARHSTSSHGQDRSQAFSLAAVPLPTIALGPDRKRHTTALPALAVPLPRAQRMRRHRSPTTEKSPALKRALLSGAATPPRAEASGGDRALATAREGSLGIERGLVLRINTRTDSCEQCSFRCLAISTSSELLPPGCPSTPLHSSAAAASKIIEPHAFSQQRVPRLSTAPEKTPASKRASRGVHGASTPSRAEASGGDRALARARECSLGIERGLARHQGSAPREAVASKKVGKFERGEGMPKGASDLRRWQSATRFYSNIVQKRSRPAGSEYIKSV